MISRSGKKLCVSFLVLIAFAGYFSVSASAQFGDLPIGGDPGVGAPGPGTAPGTGRPGGPGVGGGGGGFDPNNSQATNINPEVAFMDLMPDTRNQGFVGATSQQVLDFGFVGGASPTSGPGLAPGASFGGGNNVGRGTRAGGGARPAGGANNRMGAGFGAIGTANGFEVARSGLRTTWTPNFISPIVRPEQVVANFNNSFRNLPVSQGSSDGYQIEMVDSTAIVTGNVTSQAEADRLINQLRLQPGVYKIDNRLEVRQ